MKRLIPVILTCAALLLGHTLKAQSFTELLVQSEQVKAQYGETDDRYLDALSQAIQAAFSEQKNEEANKYRSIHADIVKGKYGENSLEYAEDIWRLGNVSNFKGEQYQFDCYKKVQRILETINAKDSFIYFNLFWNFFWHYWDKQNWILAATSMQKYINYAKPWINKEWKGNTLGEVGLANAYYLLGLTYFSHLNNYTSAIDAFKECIGIIEKNQLLQEFPNALVAYQGIWLGYENLKDYEASLEWHQKSVEATKQLKGDTSEEYLAELSSLRYCYYSLGDFDSTKNTNLTLLTSIENRDKKAGVDCVSDSLYVKEFENLVRLGIAFKRYPEVLLFAPKLSEIYQARGEEKTEVYLSLLDDMILAYHNTNSYLDEYSLYDQYESLARSLNLTKTEDYWSYLSHKCEGLTYLYKIAEHAKAAQDWGDLTAELYGKNSRQALMYTYQIANQHESIDQHNEAIEGIEDCFKIINSGECAFESKADSLLFTAAIHNLEGMAYTTTDTQRAEKALLTAIEDNRLIGRNDYAPLLNLGLLYYQQKRDLKRAGALFEQAKQALENNGDNYSIQYITVLNDLGLCYNDLGLNSYAIAIFDLASQTVLANYGKLHVMYGTTEQNKSLFYTSISNYPEAINSCKEAADCYRYVFGENSEKYGMILQNLGLMYQYVGDYTKSKELLLAAIPILENFNSPYCIHAYTNLLTVYAVEKNGDKVADLANIAEAKLKENHWEETDVAASLYGSIGYAFLINGLPNGKPYLGYALNLLDKAGAKASIQYHNGLLYLGMASFLDNSQTEDIIPVLTESYKSQYLTNAAFFNSSERESLISGPRFSQTQSILFSSRQEGKQDLQLYNFLLFNKGLLLGTSISYANAVYDSGNEEVISQYEKLQRLNRFLNGEKIPEFDGLTSNDALSQSSALERELTLYLRQNGGFTDGLNYTYSDIQNALANNEVAIEFVSFLNYSDNTSYYAAMVARHDWKEPKYVPLCKKEDLEKLISLSPDRLYGETPASENAYKLLWEPLIPYFKSAKIIYFAPAGHINKMAIEHLYNGEKRFNGVYNVIRLTSTRELCRNKSQHKYSSAVLYGGLKYDEDDETMIAESRSVRGTISSQPAIFRGFDNSATRKGWEYLPGTLEEVNQISSIISKNKIACEVYTSGKGNEESFKALSGNDFDILHIATHGFYMTVSQAEKNDFFTTNPFATHNNETGLSPLQRSGLLLAGGNKAWKGEFIPEGVEDGVLTAAEISSLDLNRCDVVVLSACETGLGEITDEGVFGLQRAFKNAGVNTIIMSLWEVDDQATSLMMQTFYSNLVKGKSKRDSFSAAQNKVRKKYTDPRYWAAFIMLD